MFFKTVCTCISLFRILKPNIQSSQTSDFRRTLPMYVISLYRQVIGNFGNIKLLKQLSKEKTFNIHLHFSRENY